MKKIVTGGLQRSIERRQFLKGATLLGAAGAFPAIVASRGLAQAKPTLVNSIRSSRRRLTRARDAVSQLDLGSGTAV